MEKLLFRNTPHTHYLLYDFQNWNLKNPIGMKEN